MSNAQFSIPYKQSNLTHITNSHQIETTTKTLFKISTKLTIYKEKKTHNLDKIITFKLTQKREKIKPAPTRRVSFPKGRAIAAENPPKPLKKINYSQH